MPSQKRLMSPQTFQKYKEGFQRCRAFKDEALAEAEDLREPKEEEIDSITKLQQQVGEHIQCSSEAMAPKKIKKEVEKNVPVPQALEGYARKRQHPRTYPTNNTPQRAFQKHIPS